MSGIHSPEAGLIPGELVERLEAASVGSAMLDCDICEHFGGKVWGRRSPATGRHQWMTTVDGKARRVLPVTTSLDAALALAERRGLDVWQTLYAAAMHWKAHDPRGPVSKELPLAMCLVILKATTAADTDSLGISRQGNETQPSPQPDDNPRETLGTEGGE